MVDYLHGPVQHDAFFRKYASKKFLKGIFFVTHLYSKTHSLTNPITASIVLRQWAKKFAPMYLDSGIIVDGGDTPQI